MSRGDRAVVINHLLSLGAFLMSEGRERVRRSRLWALLTHKT